MLPAEAAVWIGERPPRPPRWTRRWAMSSKRRRILRATRTLSAAAAACSGVSPAAFGVRTASQPRGKRCERRISAASSASAVAARCRGVSPIKNKLKANWVFLANLQTLNKKQFIKLVLVVQTSM